MDYTSGVDLTTVRNFIDTLIADNARLDSALSGGRLEALQTDSGAGGTNATVTRAGESNAGAIDWSLYDVPLSPWSLEPPKTTSFPQYKVRVSHYFFFSSVYSQTFPDLQMNLSDYFTSQEIFPNLICNKFSNSSSFSLNKEMI